MKITFKYLDPKKKKKKSAALFAFIKKNFSLVHFFNLTILARLMKSLKRSLGKCELLIHALFLIQQKLEKHFAVKSPYYSAFVCFSRFFWKTSESGSVWEVILEQEFLCVSSDAAQTHLVAALTWYK